MLSTDFVPPRESEAMSTEVATKCVASYELITRNGSSITSVTPITAGQIISVTGESSELDSKMEAIQRAGAPQHIGTKRYTIWKHLVQPGDYLRAVELLEWWNQVNISDGLYLPWQDSIKSWSSGIDGQPGLEYKEDWDENLSYIPNIEYEIKTIDDSIYSGDKYVNITPPCQRNR